VEAAVLQEQLVALVALAAAVLAEQDQHNLAEQELQTLVVVAVAAMATAEPLAALAAPES
jgi:hypothetical protein